MAVIGLYGVTAFIVTQPTQEVEVRIALAGQSISRSDILSLIVWDEVRLIALGGTLGLGAALAVSHLLRSLLFSIGPYDPVTFVGGCGVGRVCANIIGLRGSSIDGPASSK
jgi:hypothetical protein